MSEFNAKQYWEKRLEKNYGLDGVGYWGHGKSYNEWMYKIRKYIFNKYVKKIDVIPNELSVLDIGSGTGFYIDRWKEYGAKDITGSDLTNVAVNKLTEKYMDVSFVEMDVSEVSSIAIEGKKFNVISAFDVLFHIVDDKKFEQAIKNINNLLKPNGYFILSDNFIHSETTRGIHHVNRSLKDFKEVLEKEGFEILIRKPSFYFLNAPVEADTKWLRKIWNFLSNIICRGDFYGNIIGAIVFSIDFLILQFINEGPSTEFMICRKIKISELNSEKK